jgi:CHAD domain-containing protein
MPFVLAFAEQNPSPADRATPDLGAVLPAALMAAIRQQIRIAIDEVGRAGDLTLPEEAATDAVHEARKATKRIRSMLRMLCYGLGRREAKAESQRFAQIARTLAASRELQAAREALEKLDQPADSTAEDQAPPLPPPPPAGPDYPAALAAAQAAQKQRERAADFRLAPALRDQALDALGEAQKRASLWSLRGHAPRLLRRGLRRAVRRAHHALDAAQAARTDEQINLCRHELRKRVKDLYYMVTLLSLAEPDYLDALGEKLDQLADNLGDDHDLALLADKARACPDDFGGEPVVAALLPLITHRQQALRHAAEPLLDELPALRPRAFGRRVVRGLHHHLQDETTTKETRPR